MATVMQLFLLCSLVSKIILINLGDDVVISHLRQTKKVRES